MDAVDGKRNRDAEDTMGTSENLPVAQEKRCRVDDLHLTFVVEKELVTEHG